MGHMKELFTALQEEATRLAKDQPVSEDELIDLIGMLLAATPPRQSPSPKNHGHSH